jgi:Mrp family chromosome partitioning ATPase
VLLGARGPRPTDDIRSEFGLIVIDAPSLATKANVAPLAAHADLVILVVRDGAVDQSAIGNARAALSKFGAAPVGIVLNRAPAATISAQHRGETLGLAS